MICNAKYMICMDIYVLSELFDVRWIFILSNIWLFLFCILDCIRFISASVRLLLHFMYQHLALMFQFILFVYLDRSYRPLVVPIRRCTVRLKRFVPCAFHSLFITVLWSSMASKLPSCLSNAFLHLVRSAPVHVLSIRFLRRMSPSIIKSSFCTTLFSSFIFFS